MTMPTARDWQQGAHLDVAGRPQRLVRFVLGYEPIPHSLSVAGGDPYTFFLEPVTAVAVVYERGWVLLDSGFNVDIVRDSEARGRNYNYDSYTAVVPPGDPLVDQVALAGLDWAELAGCAISHVHVDHVGGVRLLENGPPIVFQRAEWEFASTVAGLEHAVIVDDYSRNGLDIVLIDGDTEFAPGITALDTSGHTPGHQSFAIELPDRMVVLACDAADLRENITESIACGTTALPGDAAKAVTAIQRLTALDALDGVEVWPGHDPEWLPWKTVKEQWT